MQSIVNLGSGLIIGQTPGIDDSGMQAARALRERAAA